MSRKHSRTTADYIQWEEMLSLLSKLEHDGKFILLTLIAVGCYTGLRISDILPLTWDSFADSHIELREFKTKKYRKVKINPALREIIERIKASRSLDPEKSILFNPKRQKLFSMQYINRRLKEVKVEYGLTLQNFSTHSFRKTFGRRVWSQNDYSEKSLILLSIVFNHANTQITRRYLGITDEEIEAVYDSL
jgi:integrase